MTRRRVPPDDATEAELEAFNVVVRELFRGLTDHTFKEHKRQPTRSERQPVRV